MAPWLQRAWQQASEARAGGRLAHGLLLTGPERLGKRALAERLVQALLCPQAGADGACGRCRACTMFQARYQRDPLETRPDETPAHPDGHPGHPDARYVGYVTNEKASPKRMYQELVIEQIRELSSWLVLSPQLAGPKVALIEPAHALTHAAANALLKTLEEPVPGRYLVLVSDQPQRLPATVRSRCQRLEVKLPPREEALAWLAQAGHDGARAAAALAANHGHPGRARHDLEQGGMELRAEVARDLLALAGGKERVAPAAQRWCDERLGQRLQFAAETVRDWCAAVAAGDPPAPAGLSAAPDARRLAEWFDEANRCRALLRTTLRQDLMLAELLRRWRDAAAVQPAAARR
jgi:DNA polymerase III subunit delta'